MRARMRWRLRSRSCRLLCYRCRHRAATHTKAASIAPTAPLASTASHQLPSPQAELSSLPPRQPHPPLPADGIRCLPTPSHASAPHPAPSGPSCASTDTDANSRASVVPRAEGLPQPAAGAAAQGGPAHRLSLQLPAVQSRVQSRAGQPHMGSLRQASTEAHSAQAPKSAAAPSRRADFLRGRRPRFAKRTQGQLGAQAGVVQATGAPTEARRPSTVTV